LRGERALEPRRRKRWLGDRAAGRRGRCDRFAQRIGCSEFLFFGCLPRLFGYGQIAGSVE
jgi:hypothetical protein